MSAVDDAFQGLREMISSGRVSPGERLPVESELCEELGVSRGSLREAVRIASALGLIESRHGSGTYVSRLRPEEIFAGLSLTIDLLPLDGLIESYEMRRVLESHSAAQAAAHMTPERIELLNSLVVQMEQTSDPELASALDAQYHDAIAGFGGNPTISTLLAVLRTRSRAYQLFSLKDGQSIKKQSDASHRAIFEALKNRDPVAAMNAAASHVATTEQWLREHRTEMKPRIKQR
jgi:GntR family transcriptional regulator, transcriptional repressor for pyruvate dehydrogenase complex